MKMFMLGFFGLALSVNLLTPDIPPIPAKTLTSLWASPQIVQGDPEPPEYPKGVYCSPKGDVAFGVQTADHPCHCQNMYRESEKGCCDVKVSLDSTCMQFCHEQHCSCPIVCIPGKPDETEPPPDGAVNNSGNSDAGVDR